MHGGGGEWTKTIATAITFGALTACSPLGGSEDVVVIARGDDGNYGLHTRHVRAADLHALRGETTEFLARPTVVVEAGEVTRYGGAPLDIQYGRDGNTLVALDYSGLLAVTAYHHLAQAHDYFQEIGFERDIEPLETLYLPLTDYGGDLGPREYHDNAAYDPSLRAFLLFDERWLDFVPLAANEGVITHEFGHAVFHEVTGMAGPDPAWDHQSANMWRSVNEGISDIHAVAFTDHPQFGLASAGQFVLARNVAADDVALTEELLATTLEEPYDPYPIGTVIAAAFWDYRNGLVDRGWSRAEASRAMGELAYRTSLALAFEPSGFHVAQLAQTAAEQTAGPERALLCSAFDERAALIMPEVEACQ